jgi:Nucleotidyl transferase AbiEii toxin, Type IV TA system
MIDLADEFEAVISALTDHGIDYAVCGGLAMAIHGLPRATTDIDLLIRPEDEQRIYAAVEPLGFRIRATPMHFDQGKMEIRRVTKIDPAGDTLMLDLLLVTSAFENVWRDRATIESDFGLISVVSREGLIELKSGRMSGVDQDDIKRLRDED